MKHLAMLPNALLVRGVAAHDLTGENTKEYFFGYIPGKTISSSSRASSLDSIREHISDSPFFFSIL